ncbi:WXG100 family type VII secretion target [Cryptosporangium arvum]|uniref:WXG100 family type VII secretion target n=1 Tax=Cryptosporangium arvum TaxID=80871 RepID=UPI00147011C9|nr:WXG100 family type VII secretion target [Cryptosporangium arvum]
MALQAQSSTMQNAAKKAENVGEGIAANLANLLMTIETTGAASMRGDSGKALQAAAPQIDANLKKILNALNTIASHVSQGAVEYSGQDGQAAAELNNLTSAFDINSPIISALNGR